MSLNYFNDYSSHVKSESAPTYLEECALLEERERNINISIVNMLSSLAVDFSLFYSHCFCNRLHSAKVDILRRTET